MSAGRDTRGPRSSSVPNGPHFGYVASMLLLRFTTGLALLIALQACAAPRDPELERAIIKFRLAEAAPRPADEPSTPSTPPPAPASKAVDPGASRPLKTYDGNELARIAAAIPGTGARITAAIETAQGTIECILDERAPQTTANFIALALGQTPWRPRENAPEETRPFYDGLRFHRAQDDFIIQAGNPTGAHNAGPGWRIARETGANDLFAEPGTLAMIDDGDLTHGSQFFIVLRADKGLGRRYAAFGRCGNLELVRAIANAEKKPTTEGKPSTPKDPVAIERLTLRRTE